MTGWKRKLSENASSMRNQGTPERNMIDLVQSVRKHGEESLESKRKPLSLKNEIVENLTVSLNSKMPAKREKLVMDTSAIKSLNISRVYRNLTNSPLAGRLNARNPTIPNEVASLFDPTVSRNDFGEKNLNLRSRTNIKSKYDFKGYNRGTSNILKVPMKIEFKNEETCLEYLQKK